MSSGTSPHSANRCASGETRPGNPTSNNCEDELLPERHRDLSACNPPRLRSVKAWNRDDARQPVTAGLMSTATLAVPTTNATPNSISRGVAFCRAVHNSAISGRQLRLSLKAAARRWKRSSALNQPPRLCQPVSSHSRAASDAADKRRRQLRNFPFDHDTSFDSRDVNVHELQGRDKHVKHENPSPPNSN